MGNMGMGLEEKKSLLDMIEKLPFWAQTILSILVIIAVAAVAGHIVGRMYAMVRYPDPEKQGVVHPVIKLAFICLLAGCCIWLYVITMQQNEPKPEPEADLPIEQQFVGGGPNYGISIG